MRERNNIIMEYGTYMLVFLASYIASLAGLYYLSGILLMGEALYLYVHWVRETGSLVELPGAFYIGLGRRTGNRLHAAEQTAE